MENPRFHRTKRQCITLSNIETPGYILDLGGGGEGVIAQMCGERVVGIDQNRRELEEAPSGGLKIVMDAKDLKFLDNSFPSATAFYFLMFLPPDDRLSVIQEAYRVLAPGGVWRVWDPIIPPFPGAEQDIYIVPLEIHLPDGKIIETGYGVLWPGHEQNAELYAQLANTAGFMVKTCQEDAEKFYLELEKPR